MKTTLLPVLPISDLSKAGAMFDHRLEEFRKEVESGAQFFYAMLAIDGTASNNEKVLRKLNTAPMFWNTTKAALQSAFFITLGRIFDQRSNYTIARLLRFAEVNEKIFTKDALADRKRTGSPNADEWLAEYMVDVYVPSTSDFRCMRKYVDKYRKIYDRNYDDIRNRIYAHKELALTQDQSALFAKAKIKDLEKLFGFLTQFHEMLWHLYHNGSPPKVRRTLSSSARMLKSPWLPHNQKTAQQRIMEEIRDFLNDVSNSTRR